MSNREAREAMGSPRWRARATRRVPWSSVLLVLLGMLAPAVVLKARPSAQSPSQKSSPAETQAQAQEDSRPTPAVSRGPYRLLWGDVHGHTAFSDGKGTVEAYFAYARDVSHLDFAVVTDHDFGHESPWRMPQENWDTIQDAVDAATEEGAFVAIAGYEWTSQEKYWKGHEGITESLFDGPPRDYNHKNAYFLHRVPYLFSAKDEATRSPDLLAAALRAAGGLAHNNHPTADASNAGFRDQWDYAPENEDILANTEMNADIVRYGGKEYAIGVERTVRAFLAGGRHTGFVGGSDTHEGHPEAHTAVWARACTREAIFEALRHRRCYAVTHARIVLDMRIDGHRMGEDFTRGGETGEGQGGPAGPGGASAMTPPRISIDVKGTDRLEEVLIVRDGEDLAVFHPKDSRADLTYPDTTFPGSAWYYVRVTQADRDEHGNPSRAWSSPIWVRDAGSTAGGG